jgi:hypothetical protein
MRCAHVSGGLNTTRTASSKLPSSLDKNEAITYSKQLGNAGRFEFASSICALMNHTIKYEQELVVGVVLGWECRGELPLQYLFRDANTCEQHVFVCSVSVECTVDNAQYYAHVLKQILFFERFLYAHICQGWRNILSKAMQPLGVP